MATTGPPARRSTTWPQRGIRFDRGRRPRRGRCHPTPASSRGDGPTSSPPAGSPRSTRPIPRWRIPRLSGLCHGRVRRQPVLLRRRLGAGPRLHALSGLHLPRAHRLQAGGPGRPAGGGAASDRSVPEGAHAASDSFPSRSSSSTRGIASRRRWSIASSSTGCPSRRQPERPFFAFLNFYDAHSPYMLPDGSVPSFRREAAQRTRDGPDR